MTEEQKQRKKEYLKAYRQANKDKIDLYQKKYRESNSDNSKKYFKERYESNKELIRRNYNEYRLKNRDKINEQKREAYHKSKLVGAELLHEKRLKNKDYAKKRYQSKKEHINSLKKNRRKIDVSFRLSERGRAVCRIACKIQNVKKPEYYMNVLGCTPIQFKAHIESLFLEGMNWDNMDKWHLDHIKPCASFDLSIPEEFKNCFHYTNQRPLWATDNLLKSSFYNGVKHYHKKA